MSSQRHGKPRLRKLTPGDSKRRGRRTPRDRSEKNRYVQDNKSFTQTGSARQIGRKVVGRPATGGLQEITLFRSGLPEVAFSQVHTGRDGKILGATA